MPTAGYLFLAASLLAPLLVIAGAPRAAALHALLAFGAMPLMWAAILHFVPVLTRSGPPAAAIARLPVLAAIAGAGIVAALALGERNAIVPLAVLAGVGATALLAWTRRRSTTSLGGAHPGAHWYAAALAMLVLGLAAAVAMAVRPDHLPAAYRAHVHLNLLGWIGLTVLGTLPVLLPTALGAGDPGIPRRLRRALPWAIGGVLLVAAGATLRDPWSSSLGTLALLGVLGLHAKSWRQSFALSRRARGPARSLVAGAAGLALVLAAGIAHGFGALEGARLLPAFATGFLLPTVLGALAQLLPVWSRPGPETPARIAHAEALARFAGARGLLAASSGPLWLLGLPGAAVPAVVAVSWMLVAVWSAAMAAKRADGAPVRPPPPDR